ncbi:DUF6042 family protein [Actinoplanes philippinensis]|uniref:DUF6042 family protein n=1 Tax=Actinoplanes philippinensis TaxID=35752 RepID=UPI000B839DB1|nr:DUF6042 family protein [Actinoplanes philippinensis]
MRVFEIDGYDPEFSTLVLRDPAGYESAGPGELDEPVGTFAGAGAGWLAAATNGRSDSLRLEAYDNPPSVSEAVFDDEMETPYHSITGRLSLTAMTAGIGGRSVLELGDRGVYRARVTRRGGAADGDHWLLQFWPSRSSALPVWRSRSRPAVGHGKNGWRNELPAPIMDVRRMVGAVIAEWGRSVSVEDVDEWTRTHRHPSDWLNAPLWRPVSEPLATGHADRDRAVADRHAQTLARLAAMRRRVDEIAAELRVPRVRSKPDVLPLLAAAGLLVRDEADRYSLGRPQRVDTVLSLPPERARFVQQADARSRYQQLAEDVLAVLRWTPEVQLETTPAELAERLLATKDQIHDVLKFAEHTGLLRITMQQQRLLLAAEISSAQGAPTANPG